MRNTGYRIAILTALLIAILSTGASAQSWPPRITIRGQEYRVASYEQTKKMGLDVTYISKLNNAAVYYIDATNSFPDLGDSEGLLASQFNQVRSNAWVPEFEALGEWLDDCEPSIELLREAYGKDKCVWPVLIPDVEQVSAAEVLLPYLGNLRDMSRTLSVRAKRALAEGDFDTAIESFDIIFKMSEHVSQDQVLISGLVGIALRSIVLSDIRNLTLSNAFSPAQLEKLLDVVDSYASEPLDFRHVMAGERRLELRMARELFEGPIGPSYLADGDVAARRPSAPLHLVNRISPVPRIVTETQIREYWDKYEKTLSKPYYEYRREIQRIEETEEEGRIGGIGEMLIATIGRVREQYARSELVANVVEITLALEIYKSKRKQYPDRLNQLFGTLRNIPGDPFSGGSLLYRAGEEGYVLYSVGNNLVDDGGVPPQENMWDGEDYVYTNLVKPNKP